jgi:hypothetical protein
MTVGHNVNCCFARSCVCGLLSYSVQECDRSVCLMGEVGKCGVW